MLKQFYKYLVRKTVNYFNDNLNSGERYFIQFEEKEHVNNFYQAINKHPAAKLFRYKHEAGKNTYNSYEIKLNETRLIIAATVNEITPNFLIILRNMLDENEDEFNNAAILFIFNEEIDSILGGAKNLLAEGQPLYLGRISKNLKSDMKESSLKKHEEEILKFYLNNISNKNNSQKFIWDLEEVLSFIEKGEIEDGEYKKFNIFPDHDLSGFSRKNMKERLEKNNEIYKMVESIKANRDAKEEIEDKFDENGAEKLNSDDWELNNFSVINESLENKNNFQPLEYIESNSKDFEDDIVYWEKPQRATKAGRRKRHIIVFNENKLKEYTLEFKFDQYLKSDFISPTSKDVAETSGKKLYVNIEKAHKSKFVRAIYKHNDETHSEYKFYIANLPIKSETLQDIKTDYLIKATNKKEYIEVKENYDGINIPSDYGVTCEKDEVEISKEDKKYQVRFNKNYWDEDQLLFDLNIDSYNIPVLVRDENKKVVPKSSKWIWKRKRETKSDFQFLDKKVRLNNQEFSLYSSFKKFLRYETEIIQKEIIFGKINNNSVSKIDIELPNDLKESYLEIIDFYNENDLLPSLAYINSDLKERIVSFIRKFNSKIDSIEKNEILNKKINFFKIGMIKTNKQIYLSPLHPLNLIYQLKINEELDQEHVRSKILDQLTPKNLLPYIIQDNKKMKPVSQNYAKEWLVYEEINNLTNEKSYDYISQIIDEKINQFQKHFNYIFQGKERPIMKINIINVENDLNILVGMIENILNQLKQKNISQVPKFEVKFYNQENKNSFDKLFSFDSAEEIEKFLGLKLDVQTYSKYDVMLAIRRSIKYYMIESYNFQYAHISFYELKKENEFAYYEMEKLPSGLSMGGLKSSVKSNLKDKDYRMGFGLKNLEYNNNLLIETAKYLNELNRNLDNNAKNPYSKNETLVSLYSINQEDQIKNALDQSMWVTFINPIVDIDFFQNLDDKTIVLHYSDQYTKFDQLDAITITNKSEQYSDIIRSFLTEYEDAKYDNATIENIIKLFNSINGEWLLNILSQDQSYTRSKLSEIASIKYMLAFLEKEDILWVPISLEEIFRIAGIAGIKKNDGLFSAKNLDVKGKMSDDILFLGVNINATPLELYIHPVEVKIGNNKIRKAKKQINKTYQVLRENLRLKKELDRTIFINKFYRNFFMQLYVSNFKNIFRLNMFDKAGKEDLEKIKNKLANDKFIISDKLNKIIGKGSVVSFEKDLTYSACVKEEKINILRFSEKHVYSGLSLKTKEIRKKLINEEYDIKVEELLSEKMKKNITKGKKDIIKNNPDDSFNEISTNEKTEINEVNNNGSFEFNNLKDIRLYFGKINGSNKKIYWEYGHPSLPNRHLLISGKSGQGKTYLIQTILYELSQNNVPSLIVDYTDGFKSNQLEDKFKSKIGDKLKQYYLIKDKIGINPFKMNNIILDENLSRKEKPYDVAERIKSVIGAIYPTLGIQQLNTIYNAVQEGVEEYGEKMNFDILREKLNEDDSGYSNTALSQLNSFFNQHPFKIDKDFSWDEIVQNDGRVSVIQLSGFSQDIKLLIAEFLLWDLWYYKKQNGSEQKPLSLVIDEAQNLDHSSKSPTAKILTEGRKFGFSGIFSTQFLRGQLSKDEISRLQMASQKIYFMPPDNELKSIASDFDNKNKWKKKLKKLVKGRCISKGHILIEEEKELTESRSVIVDIASFEER
ncbi:MAG: DNA phosphorothioation-dependent restriction protein DptH [Bacillota bacterium]